MGGSAFDLDQFAPAPVKFKLLDRTTREKVEYAIDGDPDIDLVARMLRIEDQLEGDDTAVSAALEGRDLILELVKVRRPDVTELKMSPREILSVFYLLIRGEEVAAAVASALSQPAAKPAERGTEEEEPVATPEDDPEGEALPPLASVKSSSERSSSSDGETAGVLVTGTA